ncbi:MAG: endolytic transglycosylase MltG [bacterium]
MEFISANRYVLGALGFLVLFYAFFLSAPIDFPAGSTFRITDGMSLRAVSLELKQEHFIRSRVVFEALVILMGGDKHVVESDYYFESKLSVFEVARRISSGEHHMAPIVVTIPEGFTVTQIAELCDVKLKNFDKNKFLVSATPLEGSLFPDTYYFLSTDTEENVLKSIKENFTSKISSIHDDLVSVQRLTGRTEKDIITMASILEDESKGAGDRGFIAGILWKRIAIGMPLQVDAAPETYKTKGLPKNPISNPGLEALKSALHPQSSPSLYYLHDKSGNIHYAKSFAEHMQNVLKYLK